MTKKIDNQNVTRTTLKRDLQKCFDRRMYNEQYNGRYSKEVEFLEATLADDIRECESEEDRQARKLTAKCLVNLAQRGRAGTESGGGCGGSRTAVGAAPATPTVAPQQLTGGQQGGFHVTLLLFPLPPLTVLPLRILDPAVMTAA
jgi:hypothetical protein